ncbi:PREDICTED: uncharacterized protein LOC108769758 [Trachymyrmex cornetzi]|uniref:uncharacterized protein LOC108769758 n=1 Tax=Trachymyrmex cornetzi TaxID=471704 RepID=UPI00084EF09E|nr:PREDICTED: uncharacterized protein LOC108769758 [Trachymyrmex cornetzi]
MVHIIIQSRYDSFSKQLTCLTVPAISGLVPTEIFPRSSISVPSNIRLADPEFHLPRPVDLLIGSGATLSLFAIGQINLSKENYDLYLQKTRLGWVVAGGASTPNPSKNVVCHLTNLENLLSKFWEIEEVIINKPLSEEENECEKHFMETVSRNDDSRYTVRLPFRKIDKHLGVLRAIAFRCLLSLERKLEANVTLKTAYMQVIDDYLKLGHMSRVSDSEEKGYYMPHHAVIKDASNTTKVRVVFDASAKTNNGMSLNDLLMVGPTIQNKLVAHLIRFRTYNYVLTADIEKMYRQVWVHQEDRHYQRILWRVNNEVETFQLNTLTFGVFSSSFLAIRTIQKLADDECHAYPKAAKILKQHLYVDDLLTGADTIIEARTIRDDIIALLSRGGFIIRQWASNDERVVSDLVSNALHTNLILDENRTLKTLGVTWSTRDDRIYYSANPIGTIERLTKRNILSEIAKIYDPLGLLGPVILHVKKLVQDLWRCGVQ